MELNLRKLTHPARLVLEEIRKAATNFSSRIRKMPTPRMNNAMRPTRLRGGQPACVSLARRKDMGRTGIARQPDYSRQAWERPPYCSQGGETFERLWLSLTCAAPIAIKE